MLVIKRTAVFDDDSADSIEREMEHARWARHRLLDFEFDAQERLSKAADEIAPGIERVSRIISKLQRRAKWAHRSKGWKPLLHEAWLTELKARMVTLRAKRNADQRWKEALRWAGSPSDDAEPRQVRRRAGESDEDFAARKSAPKLRSRREEYAIELYERCAGKRATDHHLWRDTIHQLKQDTAQAVAAVIKERCAGKPADLSRPRYGDPATLTWFLTKSYKGFEVVDRGPKWWTLRVRTYHGWTTLRAQCGTWHKVPDEATFGRLQITRRFDGLKRHYTLCLTVDGAHGTPIRQTSHGVVALDWGHREHGHPGAHEGIRAFTWRGDDGACGQILLPAECRKQADRVDEIKSILDKMYDIRREVMGLPERTRHAYRVRLMRSGVRTAEEQNWLCYERIRERRIQHSRDRIEHLRQETYRQAIRKLRERYDVFATEDEPGNLHKKLDTEEETRRRKRSNRDMVARYYFLTMCEQFGARVITVPSRNSTRECPECGNEDENTAELHIVCSGCGTTRDKDQGAARVILRRAQEALANGVVKAWKSR